MNPVRYLLQNALLSPLRQQTLRQAFHRLSSKAPSRLHGSHKTTPTPTPTPHRPRPPLLTTPYSLLRRLRFSIRRQAIRHNSTKTPSPNPIPNLHSPEPTSLSQRLRKLSREYGWSALGVYLALSALDFPFCFLAVRWLGTERIGQIEHWIVQGFWWLVYLPFPEKRAGGGVVVGPGKTVTEEEADREYGWGVQEAEVASKRGDATIWTQLALAYAIHKSFIFIRVPLTAAVTPKVVHVLRRWGWDIGKRPMRPKAGGGSISTKD